MAAGMLAGCSPIGETPASDEAQDPPAIVPPAVEFSRDVPAFPDSSTLTDQPSLDRLDAPPAVATRSVVARVRPRDEPLESLHRAIEELIEARRFDEAQQRLRDALRQRPDHPQLLFLMALAHFSEGRLNRAEPVLNHLLKFEPQHADARKLLTAVLTADGRCAAAIEQIDRVLADGPGDAESYTLRAAARLRCGDLAAAGQDAGAALKLEPASPRALLIRCAARLRTGALADAREDLEAARRAGAPENQLQVLAAELAQAGPGAAR